MSSDTELNDKTLSANSNYYCLELQFILHGLPYYFVSLTLSAYLNKREKKLS